MKKVISLMMVTVMCVGCATLGLGGPQSQDQIDLEAAGWLMFFEYERIKDDGLSDADLVRALLETGDKAVQAVGHPSFVALLQSRINDASSGKIHPNLQTIYMMVMIYLDTLNEETAYKRHWSPEATG